MSDFPTPAAAEPTVGGSRPDATGGPDETEILGLLRGVVDPELGSDIVDLGMVRDIAIEDRLVTITIALTTAGCPLRSQIQKDVKARVESLPSVAKVKLKWGELNAEEKATAMARARWNAKEQAPDNEIPSTTKVLTIASGKGGVGKSSVTANLAAALAMRGFTVGVLDADIWGYSIPRMLGVEGRLQGKEGTKKMTPNERVIGQGLLKVVSMGFLVEDEESALMWRGLMLNRAVQHFLEDVAWGDLDYLLIDMPPGTGDVQMGLARMLPRAEMIVVTTPARSAQKVASRAVSMARKSYLRVVGVIENMSAFHTPDGERHELFGSGGGQELADTAGVPLLGQIPIESAVAAGGDVGEPVVLTSGPAAEAFRTIADALADEYVPPVEMAGCSARMLDAAVAALDAKEAAVPDPQDATTSA